MDANSRSPLFSAVRKLSSTQLDELRSAYLDALDRAAREDERTLRVADAIFAFGRR